MSIVISGSLAYDSIMDFPDSFKNHILPDQIHILNVAFLINDIKKNYGGCAGNIAYTINLLGGKPFPVAVFGSDGAEYREYLLGLGISTKYMILSKEKLSSSATIITDKENNQITAYHIGAGAHAGAISLKEIEEPIDFGIIAPADKDAMILHADQLSQKGIPFAFDPGQQLHVLAADEFLGILSKAAFYISNDYELKVAEKLTGKSSQELLEYCSVIITTLGHEGSVIKTKEGELRISPCRTDVVVDPTGAGDAFRAGFFTAHVKGLDSKTCGQVGSVAATYAIEQEGCQKHFFTKEQFIQRYSDTYHEPISL